MGETDSIEKARFLAVDTLCGGAGVVLVRASSWVGGGVPITSQATPPERRAWPQRARWAAACPCCTPAPYGRQRNQPQPLCVGFMFFAWLCFQFQHCIVALGTWEQRPSTLESGGGGRGVAATQPPRAGTSHFSKRLSLAHMHERILLPSVPPPLALEVHAPSPSLQLNAPVGLCSDTLRRPAEWEVSHPCPPWKPHAWPDPSLQLACSPP